MIYIIVIQIRSYNFDYAPFYDKIKSIGDYIQAMDCMWFVHSDKPLIVEKITKELCTYIGVNDLLFMSELPCGTNKDGRLLNTSWNFIKSKEK